MQPFSCGAPTSRHYNHVSHGVNVVQPPYDMYIYVHNSFELRHNHSDDRHQATIETLSISCSMGCHGYCEV